MYVRQDPAAVLDYTIDFTAPLNGRAIVSAIVSATDGLELGAGSREPTWDDVSVTFWAISAEAAERAVVTVRIVDDNLPPRTLNDFTLVFRIVDT